MKKIIAITLILVLLLSIAGCHGNVDRDSFQVPEEFDTTKEYEITFWAKNDTNMTQVGIYHDAVAGFQELYPNIKVNLRLYTNYNDIYRDVITNLSTDTTPNVCITYPDHIATYMTGENVVVPLDDLMNNKKYGLGGSELQFDGPKKNEMISKFLSEGVIDGVSYAMPFMRSTEACYVNKDFVEALGYELPEVLTWDFIWEVSEAAMAKNEDGTFKVNGQTVMIPFIYKSTDNMMIQLLQQYGAGYSNSAGEVLIFNDVTEQILYNIAPYAQMKAFSTFGISSYPGNYLNAGQCIFAVDSTAGATWMGSDAPLMEIKDDQVAQFEMEVMMIPQVDTENPTMISQGPSVCIFNKEDPQEVLASWLFVQYLLTNDVQIAYAQTEGYLPVTNKAINSQEYQDYISRVGEDNELYYWAKIEASMLLFENIDNTFVTPVFNGSTSLRNAAGQMIESVTKHVRRKGTVDEAYIQQLYEEMVSLYHLDQIMVDDTVRLELGELPQTAKILLVSLGVAWLGIGSYAIFDQIRKKKAEKKNSY